MHDEDRGQQNEDGLPSWVEPRPRTGLERLRRWWRERRARHARGPEPAWPAGRPGEGRPVPGEPAPGGEPKGLQ